MADFETINTLIQVVAQNLLASHDQVISCFVSTLFLLGARTFSPPGLEFEFLCQALQSRTIFSTSSLSPFSQT